jgi:hypothetical protein
MIIFTPPQPYLTRVLDTEWAEGTSTVYFHLQSVTHNCEYDCGLYERQVCSQTSSC